MWSGDFAWGDRYVSTTVELVALLAVPLLLRHRNQVGNAVWTAGIALLVISTVIQIASLAFWCRWRFTRWRHLATRPS